MSYPALMPRTIVCLLLFAAALSAETGRVERHTVRGRSLEGALSGDSPDRRTSVYLPPSYEADPTRRYPVLYMLHGFTDSESKWMGHEEHWINLPEVVDRSLAEGLSKEMIVVMPDAHNRFFGSMYSKSVVVGDWETYVAEELVAFVDSHYRTLPARESRGLSGHSMGGYGAMRIGMKRPDVFAAVYLLSPCCLTSGGGRPPGAAMPDLSGIQTFDDLAKAGFGVKAMFAGAAAWTPNPTKPPFFLDLPGESPEADARLGAKRAANAPLVQLDQYVNELKSLEGFAFDAGDEDPGIAAAIRVLDRELEKYGVERQFEIYSGNHINRVAERIETKALPFFSEKLRFR